VSRETKCGCHINAGPEIGVASTKVIEMTLYYIVLSALLNLYQIASSVLFLIACILGLHKPVPNFSHVWIDDEFRPHIKG
jgi:hypothetical protein